MPNRYPHFMGGSQKCTQGAPPVKARNCKSMKMLNSKFAWISVPEARTMQTAVLNHVAVQCNFMQCNVIHCSVELNAWEGVHTFNDGSCQTTYHPPIQLYSPTAAGNALILQFQKREIKQGKYELICAANLPRKLSLKREISKLKAEVQIKYWN